MLVDSTQMNSSRFEAGVADYATWRKHLSESLARFSHWLDENELTDPSLKSRLDAIQSRLRKSKMSVAFVAEFSRGKSELINALFFASYGRRILPSSAGRTTMCPTELMYESALPNCIRLLPIESRLRDVSFAELRTSVSEWHEIAIHVDDIESVRAAFDTVRETKRVSKDEAGLLGFYDPDDHNGSITPDAQGLVEVPRWRHAIVNIPDPMLERGLVIIDTPGLNAIGAEPELTLNLIPSADAVLFVLAADAGVTKTDIDVWRENISKAHQSGRLVVLNKIDGLWDELRSETEINSEITRQVASVAQTLAVPQDRVFPVSAQKGLVAKVQNDAALLARSRIKQLELALSQDLVARQRDVMREHIERGFDEVFGVTQSVLQSRRRSAVEQLFELNSLRGKNSSVVSMMAARIREERAEFDRSLKHFQAMRTILTRQSGQIRASISIEQLRRHVRIAREEMHASNFSMGLRGGMALLMKNVRADFEQMSLAIAEVSTMMTAMYKTFSTEHGLALGAPLVFSVRRFLDEVDRIEQISRGHFSGLTLMTTEKFALMRRFFESIAAKIKQLYEAAAREAETWLRAVVSPIEGQVREYQTQLRRRLDSVRRVLDASDSLESRITEMDEQRTEVEQQLALFDELGAQVKSLLHVDETLEVAATLQQGRDIVDELSVVLEP